MKSIIIANNEINVREVYSAKIRERLEACAGLDGKLCYSYDETLAHGAFPEVEYIFSTWSMPKYTKEEIKQLFPALRAVFYAAGTVQRFAREFLDSGVKVFSAWAANAVPVAEYTVSQIVLANKGYFLSLAENRRGSRDEAFAISHSMPGNYGCKVGIIGAGMVGRAVCERLKSYNFEVLIYDAFMPEEKIKAFGGEKATLEEIFSSCHVISNHLADCPETRGIFNEKLFSLMEKSVVFINTGRGAQVVESELAAAMLARPRACALLDVTYPEPPESDCPLLGINNIFITPHIAGSQCDEVHRLAEYMLDEYTALSKGEPTKYEVTEKILATMA